MIRHREWLVVNLELVDRRHHRGVLVHRVKLAGQSELEITVAAALADARAVRAHGHAAHHDEVDRPERRRLHGLAARGGARNRRGLGELPAELRRVEAEEAPRVAEPRHGHEDELALPQSLEPHRALGRVGVALEALRGLPLGCRGERPRRELGAREVGDAIVERQGKTRRAALGEERPHPLTDLRLVTHGHPASRGAPMRGGRRPAAR